MLRVPYSGPKPKETRGRGRLTSASLRKDRLPPAWWGREGGRALRERERQGGRKRVLVIKRLGAPKGRYCQRYGGYADVSPVWSFVPNIFSLSLLSFSFSLSPSSLPPSLLGPAGTRPAAVRVNRNPSMSRDSKGSAPSPLRERTGSCVFWWCF